jgi:hypothetical protein
MERVVGTKQYREVDCGPHSHQHQQAMEGATKYDWKMRVGRIKCSNSAGGVIYGWILHMSSIYTYHKIPATPENQNSEMTLSLHWSKQGVFSRVFRVDW